MRGALPCLLHHHVTRAGAHVLESLAGALASVFFPAGCRLCDQLLTDARRLPICNNCLSLVPAKFRRKVAIFAACRERSIRSFRRSFASARTAEQHRFGFERARSYGLYEGTLARAIIF